MLPSLKRLSAVALYTADQTASEKLYRVLGLRPVSTGADEGERQSVLSFCEGDTQLVLHSDARRQFVELTVSVDDVRGLYDRLVRDPSYVWIETPHHVGDMWRAVVRLPDDNVFTLLSTTRVPLTPAGPDPGQGAHAERTNSSSRSPIRSND